jgi:hypothetical protein
VDEAFAAVLAVGGASNSLGRTDEVVAAVVGDRRRLEELYGCLSEDDAWLRMRAADALEKVCRQHPDWLEPYVDRLLDHAGASSQASVRWHTAQILRQVDLTAEQARVAAAWLERVLATADVDWIVAAQAMETLVRFADDGAVPAERAARLLEVQRGHRSPSVVRRAERLLGRLGVQPPS